MLQLFFSLIFQTTLATVKKDFGTKIKPATKNKSITTMMHSHPNLLSPSNDSLFILQYTDATLTNQITVVTAYFNIGNFPKATPRSMRKPDTYHQWMKIFAKIRNPTVFYLDTDMEIKMIQNIRSNLHPNLTKVVKISRSDLWSFSLKAKIAELYENHHYPRYYPNTVVPDYTCITHAKFELMYRTLRHNPFNTKYFSWLDIGCFRKISDQASLKPFTLTLPPNFDVKKVAFSKVKAFKNFTAGDIIFKNINWVSASYFVAEASVMMQWVHDYMSATEHFLSHGLMNAEQQIIYAMYTKENLNFKPKVDIQAYEGKSPYNVWYSLAYICRTDIKK